MQQAIAARAGDVCIVTQQRSYTNGELEAQRQAWLAELTHRQVAPGSVVGIKSDYSISGIGLLLALFSHRCIAALVPSSASNDANYVEAAGIERLISLQPHMDAQWSSPHERRALPLLEQLRSRGEPGFVIFSSGTTGQPKAVLHSTERFLAKFDASGKRMRTLSFLLFDHIAGMDTLFYTLCSGGVIVAPGARDPRSICRLIAEHRVEVLPASPTFLNLLCLSGAASEFDLSSVRIITYGSEPMSQSTLHRVVELFPHARVAQKYGTSEFGAPRAISRARDSLWIHLKADETEYQVRDGILWIRSPTAMLGYLNAPALMDADGWLCTRDRVEQDGDWLRILGRDSDVIMVGGEKVHPQEIEDAVLELDFVTDVVVRGEPHPITGQIVTAVVTLREPRPEHEVRIALRKHCRERLAPFKIPVKISVSAQALATERHKKMRGAPAT